MTVFQRIRGRICFGTFNEMDEPFLGFSDVSSESEAYLRAFERFRTALIPAVERLSQKYSRGGRVSKWIGNDVKTQRTELWKSRTPDDKTEAKPDKEVGCQSLNFDKPQKGKEGHRERKWGVFMADSDVVPQHGDAEEHSSVQAQRSTKDKIKLEDKEASKRVRGHSKHSNRSGVKVKSQLYNVDNSQECEEGPRHSSCRIQSNDSQKDYGDAVLEIPHDRILEIEGNQAQSAECDSQMENTVEGKFPRSPEKCFDKSGNDNFASQRLKDDSSQTPVDGFKRFSCHGELECNRTYKDVGDSVSEVHDESIEENASVRDESCAESSGSHCSQKLEEDLHYSCRDEGKLKGTYLVDTVSLERNRAIQKENAEAVQVQHLKNESRQERKVEMEIGLVSPCKPGVRGEHFISIDNSLKCDKTRQGNSNLVQTVTDEADLEKEERTQLPIDQKILDELNVEEEGSVQPQCSEKSEIRHKSKKSTIFPQIKNVLINSTWKSIDHKEPKDGSTIDEIGNKPCSSEKALVQDSPKRVLTLLKPFVVRLERLRDIEKMVRRAAYDDTINYPVIVKAGQRTMGLCTNRSSFPVQQHSSVDVRRPRERSSKTSLARDMNRLTKVDLSDGMALKQFGEFNRISLLDLDCDDENVAQPRVLEDCASSRILSAEPEYCVLSPSKFKVEPQSPKPAQSLEGLDPSADSVVSENPVPSGVQALNELGFLEHGSFQFGKEHPSIWSDVLDFGDADGSGMENAAAPRGKYYGLLPLPFEDHISGMNSGKEIEVDYISNKVNTLKELDKTCLETMNTSSEMEDDLEERAEQLCHDIFDSNFLGKECLENDPLSNEDVQKPNFESAKPTLEFPTGVLSSGKMSLKVSPNRRSKKTHGKERKHESHSMLGDIFYSTPSHKESVLKEPSIRNKYVERSKVTPVNAGESEFLTSLINPGKVIAISNEQRYKEKTLKERKRKSRNYPSLGENGTGQDETSGKIDKKRKRRSYNDSSEMETNEVIQKERKRRCLDDLCEIGDRIAAEGVSPLVPKIKAVKSLNKKGIELEYWDESAFINSLEAERAVKELEYKSKTSWLTKSFKLKKENNGGNLDDGIKSEAKEVVPTIETLYRDLSTIPYILKCNLQNRCRKCKNLNPCANANKKFKLFFTLTVGVGRRLSKPLMDTFQNEGDRSQISRTAAYIAASAAVSRPTTILVPALPEVVKKIVPMYHSNLLMQLVTETEELDKMEKKTISDMAIAETLQLKRALIAMKARYLESRTMPNFPQSDQTTPDSESIILQSLQPGHPFMYKSNQIIAMKSKVDNKFRFVRKCMVSILPSKGAQSSEEDNKKSTDVTENQLTDSQGDKSHEVETESIANNIVESQSVNQIHQSSLGKRPVSSICVSENHNESMEPVLKKLLLDPSCSGKNSTIDLSSSNSKVLGETVPQKHCGGPKSPVVCVRLNKLQSRKPVDFVVSGNSDYFDSSRSHRNSSSSHGISSMDSEVVVNISVENETNPNQTETRNVMVPLAAPKCVQELAKKNEFPRRNGLNNMDPPLAVCVQVTPDIERSESQLAKLLSANSTCGNTKQSTDVHDQDNPQIASDETPDLILIPDKVESIDLTTCEEETFELINASVPKWAVICTSLPELGFIKVWKTLEKLIIYDKAVVSEPLEINTIAELNKFLNTRLANLTYSYQSRIALEWILVTSGYLTVKTIPPTNPLFWLPSVTAKKTLSVLRNFAKRYGKPQTNTGTPIKVSTSLGRRSSLSNAQTTNKGQIKLAPKPKLNAVSTRKGLTKLNTDKDGKIVRINGQTVVMGTPVSYGKPQEDKPNPSRSAGQTAVSQFSSAQVVSSVSSGKPLVKSTPVSTPMNQFRVLTGPGTVSFTSGPRAVQPGLIYTNSPNGYVRVASNPASSVVHAKSPASSTKSSSSVPNQQSSSSPLFLVLPTTTTASSQSTSFRLAPRQPVTANPVVPSAVGVRAPPPRQTTPLHLTPVSSASKIQTPPTTASGLGQTTTFRVPLVSSASRSQTHSSLPARRAVQTTTIRRPFRQIVVTPGSVRCVNLTRIAPRSIATSNIVQAISAVKSSQKTDGPTSAAPIQVSAFATPKQVPAAAAPKQVSAAPEPKQVSAATEPKQVSSAPEPKQVSAASAHNQSSAAPAHNQSSAALAAQNVSAAPALIPLSASAAPKQVPAAAAPKQVAAAPEPNQLSAAPAPNQVSAAPPPMNVSATAVHKQLSTAPEPKKVLTAPVPQQETAATLPSSQVPVKPTTISSSLKTQKASTSTVCASTALSQKLAEALSQKLGQKINIRSNNPGNRQILIIRKGTADKVQTSNPIKLVFQNPQNPTSLPPP